MKELARGGLVNLSRGADGGYRLARPADEITAAEILDALEGPVAITECSTEESHCELKVLCLVGGAWQKISAAIRSAMQEIRLSDLATAHQQFLGDRIVRRGCGKNQALAGHRLTRGQDRHGSQTVRS